MKKLFLGLHVALALSLSSSAFAQQPTSRDDDDVTLAELPEAVRQAVEREVGDGRIEDIERDRERGKIVYELEYIRDNIEWTVDFAEDGSVLEKHQD